jgi:hypothetical protein
MGKKSLYPNVVDPELDLGWDEKDRQRQESEMFAFIPNQRFRLTLELSEAERKAVVPWLINQLDSNPNPRLLAEVLRCFILKQPLYNVQDYQGLISQMRFDNAMAEEQQRQTNEWNSFNDKPVVFKIPGYTVELVSDIRDVTVTGQPNFNVKVSNGKQYSIVPFSGGDLDFWRRKAAEELERFKTVYETEAQQLVMDLPDRTEITLVRDACETLRPLKIEDGTTTWAEPGFKIGDILAPVTVHLQLLMKRFK